MAQHSRQHSTPSSLGRRAATPRPRRAEILDTAARLFAEHGFAGVTIDHIGAACGVSGPALYHHFTSKEALLGELLVGISQHLLNGGRQIVTEHDSPEQALAALIDNHIEFAVTQPALITVHFRDLVHASREDRRTVRRLQRKYVEVWVELIIDLAPDLDISRVRTAVHAVFGLLNSTPFTPHLADPETAPLLGRLAWNALDPVHLASPNVPGRRS